MESLFRTTRRKPNEAAWNEIVSRLAAIGKRPVVDSIFSFEEVKPAFARLQQGPMGKVIVRIAG